MSSRAGCFCCFCVPIFFGQASGGYCFWNLLIENMTRQGQSQTACPRLLFLLFFCSHLFFSAQIAFVVIAQHFSASRFLSIFIKVKALSTALLTLPPPSSFHLQLFFSPSLPISAFFSYDICGFLLFF